MSNQKQIYLGFRMYSADFADYPPPYWDGVSMWDQVISNTGYLDAAVIRCPTDRFGYGVNIHWTYAPEKAGLPPVSVYQWKKWSEVEMNSSVLFLADSWSNWLGSNRAKRQHLLKKRLG